MSHRHPISPWSDERLAIVVGNLLRFGVLTAATIVLVGGIIYIARHGLSLPHYDVFKGEPSDLRSVGGIIREVFSGSGRGCIQLGLLLLIATPVMRVALLLFGFGRQHDWFYVLVSLVVLTSLLFGLFGGRL
jgi:uncharacterized membrane protein